MTKLKQGAYYINYPDYQVSIDNTGKHKAPLGHAGIVIVDSKGTPLYYEYGRYRKNGTNAYGVQLSSSVGNWKHRQFSAQTNEDLAKELAKHSGTNNIRMTYVPDVNTRDVWKYINQDANNPKRPEYNWINPFNDKSCGSEASNAIEAGYNPNTAKKIGNGIRSFINSILEHTPFASIAGIGRAYIPGGKGLTLRTSINTTPQEYEDKWTDKGYETFTYNGTK